MLPALPSLPSPTLLRGKTIVVTGGTRGIGLAIAHQMLSLGANVALLASTNESCAKAIAALSPAHPAASFRDPMTATAAATATVAASAPAPAAASDSTAVPELQQLVAPFVCDVGDEAALESVFRALPTLFPAPASQLYACAGVCPQGLLLRTAPATVTDAFRVNVGGAMSAAKLMLKHAPKGNGAESDYLRVVTFGSIVGTQGAAGLTLYAATKSAMGTLNPLFGSHDDMCDMFSAFFKPGDDNESSAFGQRLNE